MGVVNLVDGPIRGFFRVQRAPLFLRAVLAARVSVLDGLEDCPASGGVVYVYQREGAKGSPYRHCAGVDGDLLRETDVWRGWCLEQTGRE